MFSYNYIGINYVKNINNIVFLNKMKFALKKMVKHWGGAGGIYMPKELIGQEVYVLTENDLQELKKLIKVFKSD